MAVDEKLKDMRKGNETEHAWPISMHAFSDLSHVSPLMFLYLLKESYICGEMSIPFLFFFLKFLNFLKYDIGLLEIYEKSSCQYCYSC